MQYLKIKRVKSQKRSNGTPYVVPLIIKKNKKYGKVTSEKVVSKKKPVIITGGHDSGKTYWLSRLFNEHKAIWSKLQDDGLFLDSIRPLSAWSDSACVVSWWTKKQRQDEDLPPWSKLKVWERQEKIADYLSESKAVLFIDNAHKLSGRKLQIAKDCIMVSNIFLITVSDEERLPPSIRHLVLRRKPQIIRLGTETAYDGTQAMVFIVALIALGAGWWEVSLVLGGLTALSKSKRSARQD